MAVLDRDFRLAIVGDLKAEIAREQAAVERGYTAGIRLATERLKGRLRSSIEAAGLGKRLGNSVRSRVFPQRGSSLSAAGSVYANRSSHILSGFDEGSLIRPGAGKAYLAIPTENVPGRRRGGGFGSRGTKASPFEVETVFNQDLKFFRLRNGNVIAYIEAVASKSKRGWRSATAGRVKQGRKLQRVIMFVLVPQVRLRKRIDIARDQEIIAGGIESMIIAEIEREQAAAGSA